MKVEIPENLKAEMPATLWGRILSATPVVMAVVATMLAGLSSSEMGRAQYARSLAAQQQSKAGDQWSFFQAKRLRAALARNTHDLIAAAGALQTVTPELSLPAIAPAKTDAADLETRLAEARARAQAFDDAVAPVLKQAEDLPENRDGIAARAKFNAARYDAEAKLNQAIGVLYEEQVRRTNATAERHHRRSQRFFYGMLAAQAAVIISTFAIAARKRNLLWALAAAAGLVAVLFAIWVYLYV